MINSVSVTGEYNDRKMNQKVKLSRKDVKYPRRLSYLLRLWRVDEPGVFNWQASLEIPKTSECIGFASLEELFAYLMDLTAIKEL
jgi:hypothetical protein